MIFFLLIITYTLGWSDQISTTKPQWHFSSQFLTTYYHQEAHPPEQQSVVPPDPEKPSASSSFLSQATIEKAINIIACTYAFAQIYNRYQAMHAPPGVDDSWTGSLKNALSSLCPALIQTIGSHGMLFIDSTEIVFETLVYKAIAKLIVLCAYGDIGDFIKSAMSTTSSIARTFVL